jgi:hypothetical protein
MRIPYRGKVASFLRLEEVDRTAKPLQSVAMSTLYDTGHPAETRVVFAFIAALGLALASGCTDDQGAATPTDSPSGSNSDELASTPAPETIDDPEEAAIAAYLRYRQAFAEAAAIPDPDYPALAEAAADDALASTQSAIQRLVEAGLRNEGAPTSEAEVKESALDSDPVQVVVADCSDSNPWPLVVADTGEPAPGEEYGRRSIDAMVELRDGRWLVTEIVVRSIGSC